MSKKTLNLFLIGTPFVLLSIACLLFSDDIPFKDQWELIPLLDKMYSNELAFTDLWAQHNEHRILFPRIIMLALAYLSHWNIQWEIMANFVLGTALFLVIGYQMRMLNISLDNRNIGLEYILAAFLLFSIMQWENWLWGWQIQIFLNVLTMACGLFLMGNAKFSWVRYCLAIVMGMITTYSFANGLMFWFVGFILIVFLPLKQPKKILVFGIWLVVSILVVCSYFYGYAKPNNHPSLFFFLQNPLEYFLYVFAYLGAPLTRGRLPAAIVGMVGVMSFILLIYMHNKSIRSQADLRAAFATWGALGFYSIASAASTALGRAGFGYGQAMSPRYVTIANLLWIANIVLFSAMTANEFSKIKERVPTSIVAWYTFMLRKKVVLLTIIIIAFTWSSITNLNISRRHHHSLHEARQEMRVGVIQENFKDHIYPDLTIIKDRMPVLKKYKLSVFRE